MVVGGGSRGGEDDSVGRLRSGADGTQGDDGMPSAKEGKARVGTGGWGFRWCAGAGGSEDEG